MPEPGWYDDPLIPGGKRYWDGAAWTEAAQAPNVPSTPSPSSAPSPSNTPNVPNVPSTPPPAGAGGGIGGGPGMGGPPPFGTLPAGASATGAHTAGGGLGDLGEWLNQTFRALRDNVAEVLVLFFAIPAAFWALAYLSFHQVLANIEWVEGEGFSGINSALIVVGLSAVAATIVAGFVGSLAGHHLLYGAHIGQTPSMATSLGVGLKRLPRLLGIVLLLTIVVGAIAAAPSGILLIALRSAGARVALILLFIIVLFALIPLFVWIWVKMGFIMVSAAVTPSGTSAIRSSIAVSAGRFWSVFIRLGIVVAMASMLSSVTQALAQFAAPVVLFSKVELGENDLFIGGRPVETIDRLQFAEVLPNPIVALIYFTLYFLVASLATMLIASGASAIYAAAGGPNSFGHRGASGVNDGVIGSPAGPIS